MSKKLSLTDVGRLGREKQEREILEESLTRDTITMHDVATGNAIRPSLEDQREMKTSQSFARFFAGPTMLERRLGKNLKTEF